jgi:hypothetical protein
MIFYVIKPDWAFSPAWTFHMYMYIIKLIASPWSPGLDPCFHEYVLYNYSLRLNRLVKMPNRAYDIKNHSSDYTIKSASRQYYLVEKYTCQTFHRDLRVTRILLFRSYRAEWKKLRRIFRLTSPWTQSLVMLPE